MIFDDPAARTWLYIMRYAEQWLADARMWRRAQQCITGTPAAAALELPHSVMQHRRR